MLICWFVTEKRTGPMTRLPQTQQYAQHATHAVGVWSVAIVVMQLVSRGNLCIFGAAADEVFLTFLT